MQWQEFRSHIRHLSTSDLTRIERAFILGKKVHDGQFRKSGEAYFSHPITVALMLVDMHGDSDTIIAALLHDTVEDTPLTLGEIDAQFHGTVAALIDGLTKLSSADIATNPKLDEQIESMRKIFTLMEQDVRIMVIKLVDRLHNMQTIEFLSPARQLALARETQDVYVKIADKLCMQDLRDELQALCLSVLEPDLYASLTELRMKNEERGAEMMELMKKTLRSHDPVLAAHMSLGYESKTWNQLRTQLEEGSAVRSGQSFISIAFICDDIDTCYRTLGALHQHWKREVLSFQDFINAPQLNGYRGLHTTLITEDGARIRCKIRTCDMHTYARHGIVMKCFDAKALGVQDYLPWTKRIAPLTVDTEGSSTDFWQSLQSDILGETITIHGPGDTTVQLPKGATALDGVFYLFHQKAEFVDSIIVNGEETTLNAPIPNAASIDVTFAEHSKVHRDWLRWVKTGLASSGIHSALSARPREQKIIEGKNILQAFMTNHKRGSIDEFDPTELSEKLQAQGFRSTNDAFIAIAEGRRTGEEIYNALFLSRSQQSTIDEKRIYRVNFKVKQNNMATLQEVASISAQYDVHWTSIRMRPTKDGYFQFGISAHFTREEMARFRRELRDSEAKDIEYYVRNPLENALTAIVITLWALNPVIAKLLLVRGLDVTSIISIRFIVFGILAIILFIAWRAVSGHKYTPVPGIIRLAFLPTLASIALAIFTFEALRSGPMPPSLHLVILRSNILLLPFAFIICKKHRKYFSMIISALGILSIVSLMFVTPTQLTSGIYFSVLTLIAYVFYTTTTEQTLKVHSIGRRYPIYLGTTGSLLALAGIVILPFAQWEHMSAHTYALISLYTLFFVFIPHVCYHLILNARQTSHIANLFYLEVPVAILAEIMFIGIFLPAWLYALIFITMLSIFFLRKKIHSHTQEIYHSA